MANAHRAAVCIACNDITLGSKTQHTLQVISSRMYEHVLSRQLKGYILVSV